MMKFQAIGCRVIAAAAALMSLAAWAVPAPNVAPHAVPLDTAPITVSLVTFYPGDEVFSVYGHTELRVQQGTADAYFNYGVFDFDSPNFVWRFATGDAEYLCVATPAAYSRVGMDGRRMVEQRLNLTQEQAQGVLHYLLNNARPGNNTYRYRFLTDNCSTRPRDIIERAVGTSPHYAPLDSAVTYRDIIARYTANYPWEKFGIDLVLGSELDRPISTREQMFVPMLLMRAVDGATIVRDGKSVPLVTDTDVVVDASEQGIVLPPTPWYLTPMAAALALLVVIVAFTVRDLRRHRVTRWLDTLLFLAYAAAGCVVFFLVFVSEHEATSPNWNALWLHPLHFMPAVLVWIPRAQKLLRAYHVVDAAVIVLLLLAWPWLPQVANPASFPLMLIPVLRALPHIRYRQQ